MANMKKKSKSKGVDIRKMKSTRMVKVIKRKNDADLAFVIRPDMLDAILVSCSKNKKNKDAQNTALVLEMSLSEFLHENGACDHS